MIELGFPVDLYSESAVVDALSAYVELVDHELETREGRYELRLRAKAGVDERLVADELANYVLGLTIERRGR